MTPTFYYNEVNSEACAKLRALMLAGLVPWGDIDNRSIQDVTFNEVRRYTQCHFFAGIGIWAAALRAAAWPADASVWTGSCPCQPFSQAGAGAGFADERHLWPDWLHLIRQRRPPVLLGEQVAGRDGLAWFDLVRSDLEAAAYACGGVDTPACGYGAPHRRQRLYWVGYASGQRLSVRERATLLRAWRWPQGGAAEQPSGALGRLAHGNSERLDPYAGAGLRADPEPHVEPRGGAGGVGHADGDGAGRNGRGVRGPVDRVDGEHLADDARAPSADGHVAQPEHSRRAVGLAQGQGASAVVPPGAAGARPGPTNGFWASADWLQCRDGKWRPVEPGSSPLAHGVTGRVGALRACGNGIVLPQATEFAKAVKELLLW